MVAFSEVKNLKFWYNCGPLRSTDFCCENWRGECSEPILTFTDGGVGWWGGEGVEMVTSVNAVAQVIDMTAVPLHLRL